MERMEELLTRYAFTVYDKQSQLLDLIDENASWRADLNTATLMLGDVGFPAQVIGSFSHGDESWLWAWANDGLPDNVLHDARALQRYGEQHGIAALTTCSFSCAGQSLYPIAAAAVGISGADGFYLGDYGRGIILLTLRDARLAEAWRNSPHTRTLRIIPEMLGSIALPDHRAAIRAYLGDKSYRLSDDGGQLHATRADGSLSATFDAQNRLTKCNGTLNNVPDSTPNDAPPLSRENAEHP